MLARWLQDFAKAISIESETDSKTTYRLRRAVLVGNVSRIESRYCLLNVEAEWGSNS